MHGPSYVKEVYKTTPEIRTSPLIRTLKTVPKGVPNRGIPPYSIIFMASVNIIKNILLILLYRDSLCIGKQSTHRILFLPASFSY